MGFSYGVRRFDAAFPFGVGKARHQSRPISNGRPARSGPTAGSPVKSQSDSSAR